jgi:NAD(P)-dependent dehydrogenase (short-subunit alcohol dehydrogenase family)
MKLAGRVALITGGGRGIGRAVAEACAREGASVCLVARTGAELEQVTEAIRSVGGRATWFQADVAEPASAEAAVRSCIEAFGTLHVLVNAAGVYGPIGRSWEVDAREWARAIEINLLGTLNMCRAAIPVMQDTGAGRIINFSGGGATSPLPRFSAYAASKAAVVRLTETLAEELRGTGITVNAIAPGAVDTRLQDEVLAAGEQAGELYERIRRLRESGEGGVPPELPAGLAVMLASAAGEAITGKLISAAYDGWQAWDAERIGELAATPWLTLRRLDEHTLRPLLESLQTTLPQES